MRPSAYLLLPAVMAGCALPERDNPSDSNLRPTVQLRVTLGSSGSPVVSSGERWHDLYFDVRGTDVGAGDVTRVVIERLDDRVEGTPECPLLEPQVVAEIEGAGYARWTDHAGICFQSEDPAAGDAARHSIPLALRATAHTSRGAKESVTVDFTLVNARPTSDLGPTRWIDPLWGMTIDIDTTDVFDRDDVPTVAWEQLAGPPVSLTSSNLPSFTLDLADGTVDPSERFGAGFRFRVTNCDPWQCADPTNLDVVLQPAIWGATGNGLVLLDGTFTSARMFDDEETAVAFELTGSPVPELAPAFDGIWVFRPSSTVVRHIRGDFTARSLPTDLPAIFQDVVGVSDYGVVWILVGPGTGPFEILELGPGDSYSSTFSSVNTLYSQAMITRTYIAQQAQDGPMWAAGYEPGHFRITYFPPNEAVRDFHVYDGEPLYEECLGDTEIDHIAADPTGGLWIMTDYALLKLVPGAAADEWTVDCRPTNELENQRGNLLAIPLPDGSSRALYVRPPVDILTGDPELWTVDPDGTERLFADIPANAAFYDRVQKRIVVFNRDGIASFDASDETLTVPLEFVSIAEVIPDFDGNPLTGVAEAIVDRAGRSWLFYREGTTSALLLRIPESLGIVRAEVDEAGTPDRPGLAAIDPKTGAVWIAQVTTGGQWVAASFDERGPVPDSILPIPFGATDEEFLDGVKGLRFDPGEKGVREPGLWVHFNAEAAGGGFEIRVQRVSLVDGTITASFGGSGEEPAGGFPLDAISLYYGASLSVDPQDGFLWFSIHDDDADVARLGEVYRLGPAGEIERFDTISTLRAPAFSTIASPGGFAVTGGNTLDIVRVDESGMTSTVGCFSGDEAGSVTWDATTSEAILFCWDDGDQPSYVTRWDVSAGFVLTGIRTPVTPFPVELFTNQLNGRQDTVTGAYWAPDGFGLRQYDRFLQDAGHYPLPVRIRYMVQ